MLRRSRRAFWRYLLAMLRHNPGGVPSYISVCAYLEHFLLYRKSVKAQIETQLQAFLANERREEVRRAADS